MSQLIALHMLPVLLDPMAVPHVSANPAILVLEPAMEDATTLMNAMMVLTDVPEMQNV